MLRFRIVDHLPGGALVRGRLSPNGTVCGHTLAMGVRVGSALTPHSDT